VGELEAGTITSVRVHEGDAVQKGQPLAEVQPTGAGGPQTIRSPLTGTVVAVETRAGDVSRPGAPMFLLAPHAPAVAIAFVPSGEVSQLAVGQSAAVTINGVDPDRFGKAKGRVAAIRPIPVTDERLQELTGDASLLGITRNFGPSREVHIALTRANTPSGLAWTGGSGPANPLPVGVRGVSAITVRRDTLIGKALG
jgi:HlyD family secretion protein